MYLTGTQAAALLGISRRTLYHWHHEGRLTQSDWTVEHITARRLELLPRPRGPRRQSGDNWTVNFDGASLEDMRKLREFLNSGAVERMLDAAVAWEKGDETAPLGSGK